MFGRLLFPAASLPLPCVHVCVYSCREKAGVEAIDAEEGDPAGNSDSKTHTLASLPQVKSEDVTVSSASILWA